MLECRQCGLNVAMGRLKEKNENNEEEKKKTELAAGGGAAGGSTKSRNNSAKQQQPPLSPIIQQFGVSIESGINTECIQLLRQLWNLHEEADDFLHRLHLLLGQLRRASRSKNYVNNNSNLNQFRGQFQTLAQPLKSICDNVSDIERQFRSLSLYQAHCKLVLYAKIRQAKEQVTHDRLSILHSTSKLIETAVELLWNADEDMETDLLAVFQLTQVFNWCLESIVQSIVTTSHHEQQLLSSTSSASAAPESINQKKLAELVNQIKIVTQLDAANNNDSPLLRLSLKSLPASRLVQTLAQRKAIDLSKSFVEIFHKNSIVVVEAGGDVVDPKEIITPKEGNVNKFSTCFSDEWTEKGLEVLARCFSQTPSLLGRAAVKKTETGDNRLSRSARIKLFSFFHEVLWTSIGDISQDLLLWSFHHPINTSVPLVFKPLTHLIQLPLYSTTSNSQTDGVVGLVLTALDTVMSAIHSFTQLASWDDGMQTGFNGAHKIKRPEQVSLQRNPEAGVFSSDIGKKFGEIVATCLMLITRSCDRGAGTCGAPEPFLCDESAILFRLDATLSYFNSWMVRRAKVWLNGWAVLQFVACSQRDSALVVSSVSQKQTILTTRQILLTSENVSVRLAALHRQMCADDLFKTLAKLRAMPDDLLLAVGPVAKTLSMATLQSYMPPSCHWRGVGPTSGLDPDKPSTYVKVFVDRVIEPVIAAVVEFVPASCQEAMGKQVIQAACEAWLQYILQKRIHFSEWGAVQLLRDFISLRDWIRNETALDIEARKSILQLEVLKRCEGVAYLLLRSPGDVLGVGKPSRKNRRVAPSDSAESTPAASMSSLAEDDIPPEMYVPNQQMWLELRLRRSLNFFCCEK